MTQISIGEFVFLPTMSAKSPWKTHAAVGILYPVLFSLQNNNLEPPSPVRQCKIDSRSP